MDENGCGVVSPKYLLLADPAVVCPSTTESRECDAGGCAVDCEVGSWSNRTTCTPSCGDAAQRMRFRRVTRQAANGGGVCPETTETDTAGCDAECPADSCAGGVFPTLESVNRLAGCTHVSGPVEMVNLHDATADQLAAVLGEITEITGSVLLFNTAGIEDLRFFAKLKVIGGAFVVNNAAGMTSVAGADALATVGGDLVFNKCSDIETFDGFGALTSIDGKLDLDQLNGMKGTFNAFQVLKTVSGRVNLNALGDVEVISAGSLSRLETIGEDLHVNGVRNLLTASGWFQALVSVGISATGNQWGVALFGISSYANEVRPTLPHFPLLERVEGQFEAGGQFKVLLTADFCPALTSVGKRVEFGGSNCMWYSEGYRIMPALLEIKNDLRVQEFIAKPPERALDGFLVNLQRIRGHLYFGNQNDYLTAFGTAFSRLTTVDESVKIYGNDRLTSISPGLDALESAQRFEIRSNPSLVACRSMVDRFEQISSQDNNQLDFAAITTC